MPNPIRILIAEDHAVVRDGLAAVLKFEPDMTVVGLAKNGREAVTQFRELEPEVVLMDLAMPELDGAGAILAIRSEFPDARILVLTTYDNDESVFRALRTVRRAISSRTVLRTTYLRRFARSTPAVRTSRIAPRRVWPSAPWQAARYRRVKSRC
jgi:DNA-binding NarL/FixJ family response regulator